MLALLIVCITLSLRGQEAGIYADFTTSMGDFSCKLDFTNSPKAVANFIGLASGARPWLDLRNGRARTNAFYDGLLFHRVIEGFMIQGGSPNGMGTDAPGYAFPDEFTPLLRFNKPMMLAMANSGPNSNGSQFFITVANTPWLNDVHTIFGQVVSGSNVVMAISKVATDASDKPLTNVVTEKVEIRRVGAAAEAFDINAQGLPLVTNTALEIGSHPGQVELTFANRQFADNQLYLSTNLTDWGADSLGIEIDAEITNSLFRANDASRKFFHLAQIQYPSSTFAPKGVANRRIILNFSAGGGTIQIDFDGSGGGSYTYSGAPGTVLSYTWIQAPYRGRLWPIYYSNIIPMTLQLDFGSDGGGTFSGTGYPDTGAPVSVAGSFTLSGP